MFKGKKRKFIDALSDGDKVQMAQIGAKLSDEFLAETLRDCVCVESVEGVERMLDVLSERISTQAKNKAVMRICWNSKPKSEDKMIKILELFIKDGDIDLNYQDGNGDTRLSDAARRGCGRIVEFLMEQGADTTVQNSDRKTAFEVAEYTVRHLFPEYRDLKQQMAEKEREEMIHTLGQGWKTSGDDFVEYVSVVSDYAITELFNFKSAQVLTIVQGLKNDGQSHSKENFNVYADRDRLANACDFANDNGITVDKADVLKTAQKVKTVTPKQIVPIKKS